MNSQKEWWEDFFSDLWLSAQKELKTDEQTSFEVDFIQETLQLMPYSKVLDVPCGVGRHSIGLAARGYQVTGVDITLPFLSDAQREATKQRLAITWGHCDMRDLPWKGEFDGAFCFWGSFGYFDDNGNADFLRAVSRALKPGAKFLLDTHIVETLLPNLLQENSWRRVGETLMLEERHYDHVLGRTNTEWTLLQDGRIFKNLTSIRLYTYRELCQLLEKFDFADLEGYGSLGRDPFQLGSSRLYLLATRI